MTRDDEQDEVESLEEIDLESEVETPIRTSRLQSMPSRSNFTMGAVVIGVVTLFVTVVVVGQRGTHATHQRAERSTLHPPTTGGETLPSTQTSVHAVDTTLVPRTVSPSPVAANLGPCPKRNPAELPDTSINADYRGLSTQLVPITPLKVRVCRWQYRPNGLVTSESGTSLAAAQLAADANHLQRFPALTTAGTCEAYTPVFYVTFASDTRQVTIADGGCGAVGNGVLFGRTTKTWFNELARYAAASTATTTYTTGKAVGTLQEVGGPAPGLNHQIPGTVVATYVGIRWGQAKTTASQPFSMTLLAGTYRFTGTSPLINSGQSQCSAATPIVVVGGKTTRVEVVCTIR
jgi:hypothetical protein